MRGAGGREPRGGFEERVREARVVRREQERQAAERRRREPDQDHQQQRFALARVRGTPDARRPRARRPRRRSPRRPGRGASTRRCPTPAPRATGTNIVAASTTRNHPERAEDGQRAEHQRPFPAGATNAASSVGTTRSRAKTISRSPACTTVLPRGTMTSPAGRTRAPTTVSLREVRVAQRLADVPALRPGQQLDGLRLLVAERRHRQHAPAPDELQDAIDGGEPRAHGGADAEPLHHRQVVEPVDERDDLVDPQPPRQHRRDDVVLVVLRQREERLHTAGTFLLERRLVGAVRVDDRRRPAGSRPPARRAAGRARTASR